MENVIFKRALGIFSIILIIILASVACNFIGADEEDPVLSNSDEVFLTFGNVEITNEMVYNRIKARDGFVHLFNLIDASLLSDEMDAVSEEAIQDHILELTYGTSDQEEIDRLTEGEMEEMEQDFNDVLMLEGYNPEDPDEVDAFARLQLAQLNFTRQQYIDGEEGDRFAITEDDLESFYRDYKQGDAVAIPLRFFDRTEMRAVFNHFNLIENFEGGFAKYTGEEPIEDVGRNDYDEDNTEMLDDDEVLEYFVRIYNYMNQHLDPVDENLDLQGIVDGEIDQFMFNQMDLRMKAEERQEEIYADVATYLFERLKDAERPYHISSRSINDDRFFFYLLDTEDVPAFEDLDADALEDLKQEYAEILITDQQIEGVMSHLHSENNLRIHDEKLALRYEMQSGQELYEPYDDDVTLATLDGHSVTTDEFFEHSVTRIGAQYATDIAKIEFLFASDFFENAYGSNRDVFRNSSELMREHRNHVRDEKQLFSAGLYGQFGLSPEVFSWNEYLYLFGQAQQIRQQILQMTGTPDPFARYNFTERSAFLSEEDLLRQMVERTIRYDHITREIDYERYHELVEKNFENFFSLRADHILVYTDMDHDFLPDDFEDYYEEVLSDEERDELDIKRANLYDKIFERLDDGDSMQDIATEYMRALRGEDEDDDDYSEWARFRNAGLRMLHQNLNEGEELSPRTTRNYDEAFVEALKAIFDEYDEDEDFETSGDLVRTAFGFHFIRAEKGPNFDIPSARLTEDDDGYDERIANEDDMPNVAQIEYYTLSLVQQYMGEDVDISFPTELVDSLSLFYEPVFNVLLSDYYFTIIMSDHMISENVQFTSDHDLHLDRLSKLSDFYNRRLFPQLHE